MACFFRIWSTSTFWCRDPKGNIVALPMSVQAELRNIALCGLSHLEGDIFKELDDCVTPSGIPKPEEKLPLWASMWQLMLMYRDLMMASRARNGLGHGMYRNPAVDLKREPCTDILVALDAQHRTKWHVQNFFPVMAIFYHYHFRNKKSIEVSTDCLKACHSSQVHQAAKDMLDSRKTFCKSPQ